MSAVATALQKLEQHRERCLKGDTKMGPGQPERFTEASTVGDCIPQGDLYIEIVKEVPENYVLQENPSRQLVPGNSEGAKHWLEDPSTCEVFYRKGFSFQNLDEVDGPMLKCHSETKIVHPKHGPISIPAGFTVFLFYQVELRKEERKRVFD